MATEIADEPRAVDATLAAFRRDHEHLAESLRPAHVILLGTGASLAVARCARPLWQAADRTAGIDRQVDVIEAAEFLFGRQASRVAPAGSVVVAISKSGTSPEVLAAAEIARQGASRVVVVTAFGDSALAAAADDVVLTPIGEEHGAATKSETAALAALLAMGGAIEADAESSAQLVAVIAAALADDSRICAAVEHLAPARRAWVVGFGASNGVAEALALLWHEKARTPAVASTPSGFRHGLVEAGAAGDALIVVDAGDLDDLGRRYLDRLEEESARIGISTVWLSAAERHGTWIPLSGETTPHRVLEALIRGQQLTHETAVRIGTYVDGFTVLRTHVQPGAPFA